MKLGLNLEGLPLQIPDCLSNFILSSSMHPPPSSFSNTWTTQEQRHPELNLRNATNIYLPFPHIEMYKNHLLSTVIKSQSLDYVFYKYVLADAYISV
jgi:hypothetical protein